MKMRNILKSTTVNVTEYDYTGCFEPEIMRRKMIDGRRRCRRAPVQHPWRQYKMTQGIQQNENEVVSLKTNMEGDVI